MKLNAQQLRDVREEEVKSQLQRRKTHPIYFILENVYDTYNIGGLFRLADAIGVEKIYLCGEMETPPNHKIKKASIGTYKIVDWEYKKTVTEVVSGLRNPYRRDVKRQTSPLNDTGLVTDRRFSNVQIIAVEQNAKAISYTQADYQLPLALIFGNETYGVLPETLKLADQIVEIPMWGINKSLNVIVSAAIVSYHVMTRNIKIK